MKPDLEFEKLMTFNFSSLENNKEVCKYSSPLHMALNAKNTRMINLILTFMAKSDSMADESIKDIFH